MGKLSSRTSSFFVRAILVRLFILIAVAVLSGCQLAPNVSVKRLVAHRDETDLTGLEQTKLQSDLKVSWAVPRGWEALPIKKGAIYQHQQFRSPTLATGVGVAHIQVPLPIPAQ